jgi:hypothetical protein
MKGEPKTGWGAAKRSKHLEYYKHENVCAHFEQKRAGVRGRRWGAGLLKRSSSQEEIAIVAF